MLLRSDECEKATQDAGQQLSIRNLILPRESPSATRKRVFLVASLMTIGFILRLDQIQSQPVWVDEAESCINALSILQSGLPIDSYLGLPVYENTLTIPSPGDPEYEFKDSSYGRPIYKGHGLALYHGWLPLYAIAASFRLFGVTPDNRGATTPQYGPAKRRSRTVAARLPGVLFGVLSRS